MNRDIAEAQAQIAVSLAELRLMVKDAAELNRAQAELQHSVDAYHDFTRKAIV